MIQGLSHQLMTILSDDYFIRHLVWQALISIPLLLVITRWRKANAVLKIAVIIPFALTLLSWGRTVTHNPISCEVDLASADLAGKEFRFTVLPGSSRRFMASLDIKECLPKDWPNIDGSDVEILVTNARLERAYKHWSIRKFNAGYYGFQYGRTFAFKKPFKLTEVIYRFHTAPPSRVTFVRLNLDEYMFDDKGIGFSITMWFNAILVCAFLIVYGLIFLVFRKWLKAKS